MKHIDIEPTEKRLTALFGRETVEAIKKSTALICKIVTAGKTYFVGYSESGKFYTASFLPAYLKTI